MPWTDKFERPPASFTPPVMTAFEKISADVVWFAPDGVYMDAADRAAAIKVDGGWEVVDLAAEGNDEPGVGAYMVMVPDALMHEADAYLAGIKSIWDNGGATQDRYTFVLTSDYGFAGLLDCLCTDETPTHPLGFSQMSGCAEGDHLGGASPGTWCPKSCAPMFSIGCMADDTHRHPHRLRG